MHTQRLSLFASAIFDKYRAELFAALLNLLLGRNFELLREEIVLALFKLASANFRSFYGEVRFSETYVRAYTHSQSLV